MDIYNTKKYCCAAAATNAPVIFDYRHNGNYATWASTDENMLYIKQVQKNAGMKNLVLGI